jgi:hypothetical protein
LFSLWESILSRRSAGPSSKPRKLRFIIRNARGLQRPHCELDPYSPDQLARLDENTANKLRAPSPFVVVTINEEETYTTFEERDTHSPEWEEVFDVEINDLATVVIRVFDRKCIDRDWPAFIGFTTLHPFTVLPYPQPGSSPSAQVELDDIPLVRDGATTSDMTVSLTLSTDTQEQPTLRIIPRHRGGPLETRVERRVGLVKFGKKKVGRKKETVTHVYQMDDL